MFLHSWLGFRAVARKRRNGFTLTEVLISSAISFVAMAGILTIFMWVIVRAASVQRVFWSYTEARRSSRDIVDYVRNASAITQSSTNATQWVEFLMPNGSLTRFVVVNPPGETPRDSYMYMSNSITGLSTIIARGLTGLMTPEGFTRPIFFINPNNPRTVRIGFRVTDPVPSGQDAVNDSRISAIINTGVTLRNVPPNSL